MSIKPFIVTHVKNNSLSGIAISEHVIPLPDANSPTGVRMLTLIGVLWNETRTPSPSYHENTELAWLEVPGLTDEEEEDGDDEGNDEEENDTDSTETDDEDAEHA